ncbi:HAMP domain-containing sensor histidine kinase [Saccharothrix sp. NPDC042600]|uniref:sensor histidine kinase n=1 Tax=Saccharothrix TaxID=2071 RepID=UPI0033F8FE8E|nr:HAMP domain-containing sensor histidine kinase [Saccharothrix mutabilis subsp. capreolus]
MRKSLALVALACASAILVAVLVPLAVVIRSVARESALADAGRSTTAVVAVLATTVERGAVAQGLADVALATGHLVSVHLPDGARVGFPQARAADVVAALARPGTAEVPGGVVLLQPARLGGKTAVVEVFVPDDVLTRDVWRVWGVLAAVAVALVVGSLLLVDRLAVGLVAAVRGIAGAARRFGRGQLVERIDPSGPPELVDAALAFNLMAEQVTGLLAAERELAADLSHRLRTPLMALRLDAERLRGPHAGRVREAAARLEAELDLMIRDATQPVARGQVCDLAEVAEERMRFWSPLAEDEGRRCGARTPGAVPVPLARDDLAAAVDALVGNVFRHTPAGAAFAVRVSVEGPHAVLVVEDSGPGIADPAAALRRGVSRGSTGLGLDIARRVAESTGGGIAVRRSRAGGARVELRFPRAV